MFVLPKIASPARLSRRTCSLSTVGAGASAKYFEPRVVGTPASVAVRSFSRYGTPRKGPSGKPSAIAVRAWS